MSKIKQGSNFIYEVLIVKFSIKIADMELLITIFGAISAIFIVVVIHEWGHFVVAKWMNDRFCVFPLVSARRCGNIKVSPAQNIDWLVYPWAVMSRCWIVGKTRILQIFLGPLIVNPCISAWRLYWPGR